MHSRGKPLPNSFSKSSKMSLFSGKVLLGDLDDFIAPAQACTTGLFSSNPTRTQLVMEDDLDEGFGYRLTIGFTFLEVLKPM